MTADKILELARAELGTVEYPPSSNNVKYNTAYYGGQVSGSQFSWCAVFIWWLFKQAGASRLYYGGGKTAYCPTLLSYHSSRGQAVTDYKPGDIVFFNFDGGRNAQHVGVCESYNGYTITTIDGNTGTGSEANGGAVMRRTRNKKYIVGAYRPDYGEGEIVTQDQFNAMAEQWLNQRAAAQASTWATEKTTEHPAGILEEAKAKGITDGTRPRAFATREEVAAMVNALSKG